MAFAQHRGGEAPALLLAAGRRLEAVDPVLAQETYLDARAAAIFAPFCRFAQVIGGTVS
jgi:hypothetical protein